MDDPIIPEFEMHRADLEESEIEELKGRLAMQGRTNKDRFMLFTDILIEYVGSSEYVNRSDAFLSMCAKACFLRGMYGYNQILAKNTENLACRGYAAAAYCRQSLDPRWLNNLRNITNQSWQAKEYITYAELSGQLASVLMDLGYAEHANDVVSESIDKVTLETSQDEDIRHRVQCALLRPRVILAYISGYSGSREESLIRLDSAHDTAQLMSNKLALSDIQFFRARAYESMLEHDRAMPLVTAALRRYERMGYLHGVAEARNLRGVIHLNMGQLQEARDQFEETLIIQQQLNNQVGLAATLINVGEIDRTLNQLEQMETYNRRALEISQEAEYMRGILVSTVNLGDVEMRRGNIEKAIERYEEGVRLAEGAGLRQTLALTLFLVGDAQFAMGNLDEAMETYRRAHKVSQEVVHKLHSLCAEISEVVTSWAKGEEPDTDLLEKVREAMGPLSEWEKAKDSSLMVDVRRRVLDPETDSDVCVLFDPEKAFECRYERTELRKECFGNLFWKGSLCPYFKEFLTKLAE
ncbi:tetratricopeptide repeat protein [Candidatus Thorarchaeota archaeon]|nr:MAG: tetratricopeptide repeat protein [Candidatus Thorarchaeota archaeon]